MVNTAGQAQRSEFVLNGVKSAQSKGSLQKIQSSNLEQMNSFDTPTALSLVLGERDPGEGIVAFPFRA